MNNFNLYQEANGGATEVEIGPGLTPGTPYLVNISPIAGGKEGTSDLVRVTLRKFLNMFSNHREIVPRQTASSPQNRFGFLAVIGTQFRGHYCAVRYSP